MRGLQRSSESAVQEHEEAHRCGGGGGINFEAVVERRRRCYNKIIKPFLFTESPALYRVDVAAVRCRKPFPDAYVSPTSFAQRMSQIEALFVRSFLTAPKSVSVAKFCDPILRAVAAA